MHSPLPASQLALTRRCLHSSEMTQMDSTKDAFPAIANKNRASESPSHLVLMFLANIKSLLSTRTAFFRQQSYLSAEFANPSIGQQTPNPKVDSAIRRYREHSGGHPGADCFQNDDQRNMHQFQSKLQIWLGGYI